MEVLKLRIILNKDAKIYIAGHNGMVGSACWKLFESKGFSNLIGKTSSELDLRNQADVEEFFSNEKLEIIIDAAAIVGGIWSNNKYSYKFLMDNMLIQNNLIKAAHEHKINKFIFLGSSCIYPKLAPQPLKEKYLLTASLEETNQWYSIAKISGVKLCEAIFTKYKKQFISLMPTNLYGPNDNFDLKTSHVLAAMIRKFHDAKINNNKEVELWGNGSPYREFMHVEDIASAILFVCENKINIPLMNVGSGQELTIKELSKKVKNIVGFEGETLWNKDMPNGTPRKLLDSSFLNKLGWKANIQIDIGISKTYQWYLNNI